MKAFWLATSLVVSLSSAAPGKHNEPIETFSPIRPIVPKALPRFAWGRDHSPLRIPLVINVLLINIDYHGKNVFTAVSASEMESYLMEVLPRHHPSCLETGQKLHVTYDLWYHVAHVDRKLALELEGAKNPVYDVPVEGNVLDTLTKIDKLYRFEGGAEEGDKRPKEGGWFHRGGGAAAGTAATDSGGGGASDVQTYSMYIVNLDKAAMAPNDVLLTLGNATGADDDHRLRRAYSYRYVIGNVTSGADCFIADGRFLLVDLTSGPSEYGATRAGDGTVSLRTLPHVWRDWRPAAPGPTSGEPNRWRFQAALAEVVREAVRHVLVPDIAVEGMPLYEEIMVAVIVLRDHALFDPLQPGHAFSIDMHAVRREAARLALPEQEVHVLEGLHSLHEHERLAMALLAATRADSVHEPHAGGRYAASNRHLIDSQALFHRFATVSDYLPAALALHHPAAPRFFPDPPAAVAGGAGPKSTADKRKERARGMGLGGATRVVPVYVLSLMDPQAPMVIDGGELYAAGKDAVVVLQHGNALMAPAFADGEQLRLSAEDPTPHILAGLLTTLGGVPPPSQRYSPDHGRVLTNVLWSYGWSPFGPFGASRILSQILVDHVPRNAAVSRLHGAVGQGEAALEVVMAFTRRFLTDPLDEPLEPAAPQGGLARLDALLSWRGRKGAGPAESRAHKAATDAVRGLERELREVEEDLSAAAEALYRAHLRDALFRAEVCFRKAAELRRRAEERLGAAEGMLGCCRVEHLLRDAGWGIEGVRIVLAAVAATALVTMLILQDPVRRKRVRLAAGLL